MSRECAFEGYARPPAPFLRLLLVLHEVSSQPPLPRVPTTMVSCSNVQGQATKDRDL